MALSSSNTDSSLDGPRWWRELVEDFFRQLRHRRRQTAPGDGTRRTYSIYLNEFGRLLAEAGVERPEQLGRGHLNTIQDHWLERLAPKSHQLACSVLRGVLRHATAEDLAVDPRLWLKVASVKVPPGEPHPLEAEQLRALERQLAPVPADLRGLRDRALFFALLTSGSRITALLRLHRDELVTVVGGGTAAIVQKGGSRHLLVFSRKAMLAIADYLNARHDQSPLLFPSAAGGQLYRSQMEPIWRRLAAAAGVPTFNSHQLRHSNATALGELHATDTEVADHLGQHGLSTVQNYRKTHLARRLELLAELDAQLPEMAPLRPPFLTPLRRRHGRRVGR